MENDMTESTYAWRISRDVLFGKDDPDFPREQWSQAGTEGPRNAPDSMLEVLRHPKINAAKVHEFRMLDDDGTLYYVGHLMTADGASPWAMDEESVFGPLDDFGRPNAGAVEIQYRDDKGEWRTM